LFLPPSSFLLLFLLHKHEGHEEKDQSLKMDKLSLKNDVKEKEAGDIEEICQLRQQNDKQLIKMREGFEANLKELTSRCQDRLRQVYSTTTTTTN